MSSTLRRCDVEFSETRAGRSRKPVCFLGIGEQRILKCRVGWYAGLQVVNSAEEVIIPETSEKGTETEREIESEDVKRATDLGE
jgi:hypothetical protein